ncbi:flavodoxin FldA [Candidatus Profftia sp. (ex Adelges kitamiensis)]|uniref:flavodoxin FldA n=1 Tax=Candidatus Profftia sp. (ex Adelges kitamiensis) TaxID=2864218 RepID=UPI001CE36C0C|nr:flavodoxin FldA [Candidatus Profftia sp. (ex Adelges kitamiensis)]
MVKLGIFFGSDTGNTENIAHMIHNQLGKGVSEVYDIAKSNKEDIEKFNILLFGVPTWYYGEVQCDWDDFTPSLKSIDFNGRLVALFGSGDQEDYAEYFCDAMGIIHNLIKPLGAKIIGYWPITGYYFENSKSLINDKEFVGLAIDEDRQPELTTVRIKAWIKQITKEINMYNKVFNISTS